MERDWLVEQLEAGRSIESIAHEGGKDPSTVSYWVSRYGLVSAHRERHASRGGIERGALAELVAEGLSIRAIAHRLERGPATVRHWLRAYGMETGRASQLRSTRESRDAGDEATLRFCRVHGAVAYVLDTDGYYRCPRCRAASVIKRRAAIRLQVIAEAGGRCSVCGYDRHAAALQFHHLDPATKAFTLRNGDTRSLDRMRAEAAKCILLCANCHAEVEIGFIQVPVPSGQHPASGVAQEVDPG